MSEKILSTFDNNDSQNHEEHEMEIAAPREGAEVELDGERFRFVKVSTGSRVWDSEQGQLVGGTHSIRTWFSHSTEGVGAGPGWDGRFSLTGLTPEEMMQRYGHVFTASEIAAPSGRLQEYQTEDGFWDERLTGGTPDDIPYYALEPVGNTGPGADKTL